MSILPQGVKKEPRSLEDQTNPLLHVEAIEKLQFKTELLLLVIFRYLEDALRHAPIITRPPFP